MRCRVWDPGKDLFSEQIFFRPDIYLPRPASGSFGLERLNIWRGEVQWREKMRYTDLKVTHTIEAAVSSVRSPGGRPEVNSERWPSRVIMQLLPKTLVSKFGGYYFRNSASVLFQITESPGFQAWV